MAALTFKSGWTMLLPIMKEAVERNGIEAVTESVVNVMTGAVTISYRPYPNTVFEEVVKSNSGVMFKPTFEELKP